MKYASYIKVIILIALSFAAITSLVQGFYNALDWSVDFQWSPLNLLVSGQNPYNMYLDGQYDQFIFTGFPVYYHSVYVLLSPLGYLDRNTAIIIYQLMNIVFMVIFYYLYSKSIENENHRFHVMVAFLLLLSSTSFRVAMGNGQLSIFVLSFYSFFLFLSSKHVYSSHLLASVGIAKYSFAPNFLLHIFLSRKYLSLVYIFIISLLCMLVFEYMSNSNFFSSMFSPIEIWTKGDTFLNRGVTPDGPLAPGNGDLMSIMKVLEFKSLYYLTIPIILSILLHLFYFKYEGRDILHDFGIIGLLSLMFYQHLFYDYVLLLPLLLLSFKFNKISFFFSYMIICYAWFSPTIFSFIGIGATLINITFQFFLFITLFIIVIHDLSTKNYDS